MKARQIEDLRALLAEERFTTWWRKFTTMREERSTSLGLYESLLERLNVAEFRAELFQKNAIDTVYLSGEQEDESAAFFSQATRVENDSIQAVSEYEEQRYRASDGWIRLGATEKALEDAREDHGKAVALGAAGVAEKNRLEQLVRRTEREQQAASQSYQAAARKKDALWEKVETLWARSLEFSLLHAERLAKAGRVKREAEELFYQAEQQKLAADGIRTEADTLAAGRDALEENIQSLFSEAQSQFECVAGEDFLYWGSASNDRLAWCVSLITDERRYNMVVRALAIYQVTAKDGIRRIEPLQVEGVDSDEGDRRMEAYFKGPADENATSARSDEEP